MVDAVSPEFVVGDSPEFAIFVYNIFTLIHLYTLNMHP